MLFSRGANLPPPPAAVKKSICSSSANDLPKARPGPFPMNFRTLSTGHEKVRSRKFHTGQKLWISGESMVFFMDKSWINRNMIWLKHDYPAW